MASIQVDKFVIGNTVSHSHEVGDIDWSGLPFQYVGQLATSGEMTTTEATVERGYVYELIGNFLHTNGVYYEIGDEVVWNGTGWDLLDSLVKGQNVIFFGKHGSNSNTGKTWSNAVATITQALDKADNDGLYSAIFLANTLKIVMNTHASDTTQHSVADAVNFPVATADASDLATLLTLTGDLLTAYAAHNTDAALALGWTFHIGQSNNALASAVAPISLSEAVTRLNDMKAKYNLHDTNAVSHTLASLHTCTAGDATTKVPGISNRYVLFGFDAGSYTENFTLSDFVSLFAPNATVTGAITTGVDTLIKIARSRNTGAANIIQSSAAANSFIDIDSLLNTNNTAISLTNGYMYINVKELGSDSATTFSVSAGELHGKIGYLYSTGAFSSLYINNINNTVITLDVNYIFATAAGTAITVVNATDVGITSSLIKTTGTAYNVDATSVLNLTCSSLSGTETVAAGGTVNKSVITNKTSTTTNLPINNNGTNSVSSMEINLYNDQTGYPPKLYLNKSHTDTAGSLVETITASELGHIIFQGVNSTSARGVGATIKAIQNGVAGATYVPTDIFLETSTNAAVNTNQLVLNTNGFVGVGTSSPSSFVDIQKSGTAKSTVDFLEITNSVNAVDMDGTGTGILFNQFYYDAATPAVADIARIAAITEADWTSTASTQDGRLSFQTALDGTVLEKMTLTSAGYLGLGVTPSVANIMIDVKNTAAGSCYISMRGTNSAGSPLAANGGAYVGIDGAATPNFYLQNTHNGNYYIGTNNTIQFFLRSADLTLFNLAVAGTHTIGIGGDTARTFGVEANVNTAPGQNFTIDAGSNTAGGTADLNAGMLQLNPGLSKGTGFASVRLARNSRAATTGTALNSLSDAMIIPSSKFCADNTSTDLFNIAVAAGTSTGCTFTYIIKTIGGAGSESHTETGTIILAAGNNGAVTVSIAEAHTTQLLTAGGTYTVTFAATAANPTVISVTADSTLNVTSTIFYNILNIDSQAVTQL